MTGFPWAGVMEAGLGKLKLSPDAFWRMTPRELAAAIGTARMPMGRRDFEALMENYPDD
jgi:uncharacterized phage protein (TIGR02216 family)